MNRRFVPLNLKTANEFVAQHNRHNDPTSGHKFSIGLEEKVNSSEWVSRADPLHATSITARALSSAECV